MGEGLEKIANKAINGKVSAILKGPGRGLFRGWRKDLRSRAYTHPKEIDFSLIELYLEGLRIMFTEHPLWKGYIDRATQIGSARAVQSLGEYH